MGVDLGLLSEEEEERPAVSVVACLTLSGRPVPCSVEVSVGSLRPPPVTKKVSSKTTSAEGDVDELVCSSTNGVRKQVEGAWTGG